MLQETLKEYKVVFDAVYNPKRTTLLEHAEAAGAITVSGVEMFLRQAVGQYYLFTGSSEGINFSLHLLQMFIHKES